MSKETDSGGKRNRIILWVLKGLLCFVFAFSIFGKLAGIEQMTESMTRYGLADQITMIGLGELAAFLLFLVPRTTSAGVLLLSAHMGGAIVTHMQHGEPYIMQSVILVLVAEWVVGVTANPAILGGESRGK